MAEFQSSIELPVAVDTIYAFLQDCNQHEQLQPKPIEEWASDKDTIHFTINRLGRFTLHMEARIPQQEIRLRPSKESPIALYSRWQLTSLSEEHCRVSLHLKAELNMMMKLFAAPLIQQLADYQTQQLKTLFT